MNENKWFTELGHLPMSKRDVGDRGWSNTKRVSEGGGGSNETRERGAG